MSRCLILVALLCGPLAQAGGAQSPWRSLSGAPVTGPRLNMPCPALHLPLTWDVRSQVYADVTGDGTPECVLSIWRPWNDWPLARWATRPTPIVNNRDALGYSSHIAVLKPRAGGRYAQVWVGSALFQPVTALTVRPDGTLVTLETTYAQGRSVQSVALSEWRWTGFGFVLERRVNLRARQLALTSTGEPALR